MLLVTGGAGFIGSNFILEWKRSERTPLVNLDKLVGKGRFKFIGFPIKIKGGTGAPIRAVAWLDG